MGRAVRQPTTGEFPGGLHGPKCSDGGCLLWSLAEAPDPGGTLTGRTATRAGCSTGASVKLSQTILTPGPKKPGVFLLLSQYFCRILGLVTPYANLAKNSFE